MFPSSTLVPALPACMGSGVGRLLCHPRPCQHTSQPPHNHLCLPGGVCTAPCCFLPSSPTTLPFIRLNIHVVGCSGVAWSCCSVQVAALAGAAAADPCWRRRGRCDTAGGLFCERLLGLALTTLSFREKGSQTPGVRALATVVFPTRSERLGLLVPRSGVLKSVVGAARSGR